MARTHWVLLLLFGLGFGFSPRLSAKPEVRVIESSSIVMQAYGQRSQNVYIKLLVPNLSYEKNVSILFEKNKGAAIRVVARYVGPANDGYETWEAYSNLDLGDHSVRVEYDENPEQTALDSPYFLREGAGPVLYDNLPILSIYAAKILTGNYVPFNVAVKNLAYDKQVLVHFSSDDWKTQGTLALGFSPVFYYGYGNIAQPNAEGFEIWNGSLNLRQPLTQLTYYFSYTVGGQTFIDNNFGHNYSIEMR